MRARAAVSLLVLALAQVARAASPPVAPVRTPPAGAASGSPKPARAPAPPPPGARPKGPAKPSAKASRTPGKPNEAARRAIAGGPTQSDAARGAETTELAALRAAEQELFPPASPPAGVAWPNDGPAPLPALPDQPVVDASGLPPRHSVAAPTPDPTIEGRELGWLRTLTLPALPVRWDARLVRYLTFYRDDPRGRALAAAWMRRSGRYTPLVLRALRAEGVPDDLLWVALVESGFDPAVRSPAGAAGLFQLMPDGARIYGLQVDRWLDERLDPTRASEAAAKFLSDLHRRFGSWELALAGYNMGYGGLLAAIRKYNTNDFAKLSEVEAGLPWETTLYVPKIVAMAVVAKNPAAFGLEGVEPDPAVALDAVAAPPGTSIAAVASAAGVPEHDLEALNPQLRAGRTPPQAPGDTTRPTTNVYVPAGRGEAATLALARAAREPIELERRTLRFGESLDMLAASVGTTRARLADLNGVRSDETVRAGTVLLVPPGSGAARPLEKADKTVVVVASATSVPQGRRRVFYRVLSGDTLAEVSDALSVAVDDLCRWNAIDASARLHDGMTLVALVPEAADLARVVHLEEGDARALVVGSDEFFAHFEALRGRRRSSFTVQKGDTWERVAKRTGLTIGQLERINRRSRTDPLAPGESLVVYLAADARPHAGEKPAPSSSPEPLEPVVAPHPEELPQARAPGHENR